MQLHKKQQLKNYQQNVCVLCALMAKKKRNNNKSKLGKITNMQCEPWAENCRLRTVGYGLWAPRIFFVHLVFVSLYRR